MSELAPITTRDLVRIVAAATIVLTLWLTVADVWQLALFDIRANVRAGILLAAITIPLHVRHLVYGVRGEQPPLGAWTLLALAVATLGGPFVAGSAWIREFAPLAVSILLVVRGRAALVLAGVVVLSPLLYVGTTWNPTAAEPLPGIYLCFVILWRSVTQIVPIRLLAALRALDLANQELKARAVVQTRVKIDTDLRRSIEPVLERIVTHGDAARAAAAIEPSRAIVDLQRLSAESRRGLADARRMVAGYRASSVRAELDAAVALLEASGASVDVSVDDGIPIDAPNEHARVMIRSALTDALRGDPSTRFAIRVARNRDTTIFVVISSEHAP